MRGKLLVGPFLDDLLQRVAPVEDDQVADALVHMTHPIAHRRAVVGVVRGERRVGEDLVEVFADRAALVQRPAVVDQRRDHAVGVDLEVLGRVVLHRLEVDHMPLEGESLLLDTEAHAA